MWVWWRQADWLAVSQLWLWGTRWCACAFDRKYHFLKPVTTRQCLSALVLCVGGGGCGLPISKRKYIFFLSDQNCNRGAVLSIRYLKNGRLWDRCSSKKCTLTIGPNLVRQPCLGYPTRTLVHIHLAACFCCACLLVSFHACRLCVYMRSRLSLSSHGRTGYCHTNGR